MKREALLDLNEALQNPGYRLNYSIQTELPEEEDIDLLKPITGQLEAVSTGNVLLVRADFHTRCVVECARCGNPVETDVEFQMSDEFPVEGIPSCYGSGGHAKVEDEEPYPLFKDNSLIRDAYVRQGLLLNLPTQVLCTGSWDEPCPDAVDLEAREEAEEPHGHPAFQKLANIKKEDGDS